MPVFEIDAGALFYEVTGEGPPLLLIAGFGANTTNWQALQPALARHFTLIMFDNRGAGRSCVPPGPYTTAQMAGDAAALLDHLEIGQAAVVGNSMGGMIAQEFALRHSERVSRLVLFATAGRPTPVLTHLLEAHTRALESGMPAADRALWVMPWMFSPTFMARHADVAQALAQESPYPATAAGLIAQAAAVMAHDALPRLGQVAAPTLVLSGAEDILTPAAGAQVLADAIPGAHLHILERGAHVADAEYPDAVSAAMLAFLLGE